MSTPLAASSVVPIRSTGSGWEVLMVRRPANGPFGDLYVFPGGKVDEADWGPLGEEAVASVENPEELGWRAAALRELAEEVGVFLTVPIWAEPPLGVTGPDLFARAVAEGVRFDASRLIYLSNWVTPPEVAVRFDTRFYAAVLPDDVEVFPRRAEIAEAVWVSPSDALARAETGGWRIILPTLKHLELLADHPTVESLMEYSRRPHARVEPRLVELGGEIRFIVPREKP